LISLNDIAPASAPDNNDEMKRIGSNWAQTHATLFAGSKRKRVNENATEEPDSKRSAADGDTKKTLMEEEKNVVKIPPIANCSWYLGSGPDNSPFYLRQCVMDVGEIILSHITDKKKRRSGGAILHVISGAAGIGKSWSINAFVAELLRKNLRVFFHSGSLGKAWIVSKDGSMEAVNPDDIKTESALRDDPDLVYLFDSPGSKENAADHAKAKPRQSVGVTLIFSSPKRENYEYVLSKTTGYKKVMNLPTWKKSAMLSAKAKEKKEAVEACYFTWGGNMRACDNFIAIATEEGLEEAKQAAVRELEEQIRCIDDEMAKWMPSMLQSQQVQQKFNTMSKTSPGHILVPDPTVTDPNEKNCFVDFNWRFCSPLAEKIFWDHAKTLEKDTVTKLLKRVFEVPSPKGVLFEKAAHFLITNDMVRSFQWYSYNERDNEKDEVINFPKCKLEHFEIKELQGAFQEALAVLEASDLEGDASAIALEPKDTSFDAVDMFVLVKEGQDGVAGDWRLYLLQDTISKDHSLHPVKVLWCCALFCDAYRFVFESDDDDDQYLLQCCKCVPVVPLKKRNFAFKKPVANSNWNEVERVATLLGYEFPEEYSGNKTYLKKLKNDHQLEIPSTASGTTPELNRKVVGNALLLQDPKADATAKVTQLCHVIFNVLNA